MKGKKEETVYKQFCLKLVQCFESGISERRLSCGRQKQGQPLGSLVGSRGRRKVGVVRAPTEGRLFKFSIFGFESLRQKSVLPNSSLPVTPWVSLNHICLTEWQKQLVITASTAQLTTLGKWELHSVMSCAASTIANQVLTWDPFYQGMTRDGQGTQLELLAAGWACDPGSAESQNNPPALLPSREMLVGKNPSTVARPHTAEILSMLKSINQTNRVMCYTRLACQY